MAKREGGGFGRSYKRAMNPMSRFDLFLLGYGEASTSSRYNAIDASVAERIVRSLLQNSCATSRSHMIILDIRAMQTSHVYSGVETASLKWLDGFGNISSAKNVKPIGDQKLGDPQQCPERIVSITFLVWTW